MSAPTPPTFIPAHLGWRLLALVYDSLPVLAIWMLISAGVLIARGGVPITPWSAAFWLQNLGLWLAAGVYAVLSWRRGGQTLGMRPWRLRVVDEHGQPPGTAQLWQRYALGWVSLAAFGLGLLWSLVDRDRRSWHDIASATRLVRASKP